MKILWHSNAPWAASGYGKQTKLFAPRLADELGHDVAISSFAGLQFAPIAVPAKSGPITVFPRGVDMYGNDVLELHAKNHFGGDQRGGVVIVLTDIWVMQSEILKRLNAAAWVPVDHNPCQPPTARALRDSGCVPIAMSRFGEQMLQDEGLDPVYVPHGVETGVFQPLDRAECRRRLDLPQDAFLVGMVAANQGWRKSYPQAIRAFGRFRERHPEALLYLHTWLGPDHQGVDMHELIPQELPDETSVTVCDQYRYAMGTYSDEYLAIVYSAMDVLLNPAQGEGFGVPLIEAQACGTPVIATNCTAMTELVGSGSLVGGTDVYTGFQSWQVLPDVDQLVAALELEYARTSTDRLEARRKAREFALDYDADAVAASHWVSALSQIEQRLARRPRARRKARAGV